MRGIQILLLLLIFTFAIGMGVIFYHADKNGEKKNYEGRSIEAPYGVNTSDDVRVKKISERLGWGLWEVKIDSSAYLIYVSSNGNSMIKK